MGRPRKVLTAEQKVQVEALAAFLSQEQIADYLGIGRTTFYEIMKREPDVAERYARGRARAISDVAKGLIQQAHDGNVNAQRFYLETQAGWTSKKEIEATVMTAKEKLALIRQAYGTGETEDEDAESEE